MRWALIVAISLVLSGCASVETKRADRSATRTLKTIAVLQPLNEDGYTVWMYRHPANAFAVVGAFAMAADMGAKRDAFKEKMKEMQFDALKLINEQLTAELQRNKRYEVTYLERKPQSTRCSEEDYSGVSTTADAFLDLRVTPGYAAEGPTTPYLPFYEVCARLVDARTKQVLYQSFMRYGTPAYMPEGMRSLGTGAAHGFKNFDDLMANPQRVIQGLTIGATSVARAVAADIR